MSGKKSFILGLVILLISAGSETARGCTSFSVPQTKEKLFGKSYDWYLGHGMAVFNKRNVKKTAGLLAGNDLGVVS